MLRSSLYAKLFFSRFFCDFSLKGGGTLPENSYKSSQDICKATLLRRTRSVLRLARSFSSNIHTDILLLYYKDDNWLLYQVWIKSDNFFIPKNIKDQSQEKHYKCEGETYFTLYIWRVDLLRIIWSFINMVTLLYRVISPRVRHFNID